MARSELFGGDIQGQLLKTGLTQNPCSGGTVSIMAILQQLANTACSEGLLKKRQ
jgi:hypothetical protein